MQHLDIDHKLNETLKKILTSFLIPKRFCDSLNYACIPAGKLFRPKLMLASYLDFSHDKEIGQHIYELSCALEIHHSYTLAHDDLPCMDDDDMRRGRPSLHKKYSEWEAVLSGDALLIKSFDLIIQSRHQCSISMLTLFSKLLGAEGLIHGQYLDLSGEMTLSFSNLATTHILKTSRLLQASLLLGYLSSLKDEQEISKSIGFQLYKLGKHLGLCFQFLDDLLEFSKELSKHEQEVSPWINYPEESLLQLKKSLAYVKMISSRQQYKNLNTVISSYLLKTSSEMTENRDTIESTIKKYCKKSGFLDPIMASLN